MKKMWKLNTSNQGKFEEFKRLFAHHGVELDTTHIDLKEIDADILILEEVVYPKTDQA